MGGGAARTLGYYEPGDGGGALYEIIDDSDIRYSTSIDDRGSVHDLDNGNKSLLNIENNIVNVKQFGAKGDNITDDTVAFQNAGTYLNISKKTILYVPTGRYRIKPLNFVSKRIRLIGANNLNINGAQNLSTLCPYNNNQDYLVRFAGDNSLVSGCSIENIILNGDSTIAEGSVTGKIVNSLLVIYKQNFFTVKNCGFINNQSKAISLQTVMESYIQNNVFRRCGSPSTGAIYFENYIDSEANNCNNIHIDHNTFGYNSGNWITSNTKPNLDTIWIEENKFEYDGTWIVNNNSCAAIKLYETARVFINNNSFFGFELDNNNYMRCIHLVSGIGPISINNNLMGDCEVSNEAIRSDSPVCLGNNNYFYHRYKDLIQNSTYTYLSGGPQYLKPLIRRKRNVFGRKQSYYTQPSNYYEICNLGDAEAKTFIYDADSINETKIVLEGNYDGDSRGIGPYGWSFFRLSKKAFLGMNGTLRIQARIKNVDDGVDKDTKYCKIWYFNSSIPSSLNLPKHPTDDWSWVTWELPLSEWEDSKSLTLCYELGEMLLDGITLEVIPSSSTQS